MRIGAMRKGIGCLLTLFLPLLMLLSAGSSALANGKAYVAVFYREFEELSDPETADIRTALNEALADMGIAYQEYNGKGDPAIQSAQVAEERDAMFLLVNLAGQNTEDAAGEILAAADGRPVIFFDCKISREIADAAEDLCVQVNAAAAESLSETEQEAETEPPEKNIEGMADVIALIAGNYMTGAGFFEGIKEDWITDDWRVDVP